MAGRLIRASANTIARLRDVALTKLRLGPGLTGSWIGRTLSISLDDYRKRFPAGVGGGGIGIKTVRVASVTTSFFSCRDIDDAGAPIGDPFDVYPWVVDTGPVTGYNLNATGLPRVLPKYSAGHFIRIYSSQLSLRQQAPGVITPRWWAVDTFHLIGCNN